MAAILTKGRPVIARYVPGEICLVVTLAARVDRGPGAYGAVAAWFNQIFPRLLEQAHEPGDDPLRRDLFPKALRARYRGVTNLLKELPRESVAGANPWVHLVRPRVDQSCQHEPWLSLRDPTAPTAALYLYAVGNARLGAASRLADVRELVNLINERLVEERLSGRTDFGRSSEGWTLEAASSNWLNAISGNGSGGCPGARPEPSPDGEFRFAFESGAVRAAFERRSAAPPVVAVLDTSPTRRQVAEAIGRWGKVNRVLREIAPDLGTTFRVPDEPPAPPSLSAAALNARLDHFVPAWGEKLTGSHSFKAADHGLFVAGIIHDLAPASTVHLIRVLNDFGVGDLFSLASAAGQLPGLLTGPGQHLIVNMSLAIDLPSGDQGVQVWLAQTYRQLVKELGVERLRANLAAALRDRPRIAGLMRLIHLNLALLVSWLRDEHGALVVASAGNDYDDKLYTNKNLARQEPRFPARYDQAFGVAAIDQGGHPSQFANRGDILALVNGVATFGGDARRQHAGELGVIEPGLVGIVGVFSQEDLPLDGLKTTNGWVRWAGSSFSAPIASALAAHLWGAPGGPTTAGDAVTTIRTGLAAPPAGGPPSERLDAPTIRAWQQ